MTCELGVLHHISKLASIMTVTKTMTEIQTIISLYFKFLVLCTFSLFLSSSQVHINYVFTIVSPEIKSQTSCGKRKLLFLATIRKFKVQGSQGSNCSDCTSKRRSLSIQSPKVLNVLILFP